MPTTSFIDVMFGEKLKLLRKAARLSQDELGALLDISGSQVGKWESGKNNPDIEQCYQLAMIFKVSIDYMASPDDEPPPYVTSAEWMIIDYVRKYPELSVGEIHYRIAHGTSPKPPPLSPDDPRLRGKAKPSGPPADLTPDNSMPDAGESPGNGRGSKKTDRR